MGFHRQSLVRPLLFGWATLIASTAAAQVPIHGVTGTIALPANVDKFYSGLNELLVQAGDGIDQIAGKTRDGAQSESAALDNLRPGTRVVVHYTVKGIQASAHEADQMGQGSLKQNEAIVTSVGKKRVTIRFSDGGTQTLRYTDHARQSSAGPVGHGNRVVVYSWDQSGQRRATYFKPLGR